MAIEIDAQYREIRGMVEADIESRQARLMYCPIQALWYQPLYLGGIEVARAWRLAGSGGAPFFPVGGIRKKGIDRRIPPQAIIFEPRALLRKNPTRPLPPAPHRTM